MRTPSPTRIVGWSLEMSTTTGGGWEAQHILWETMGRLMKIHGGKKESRVGRKRWGEVILFLLLATDLMGGTFLYVAISHVDFPSFLYEHANKK